MARAVVCFVLLALVKNALSMVNNSMIEARNALEELKNNKLDARRDFEPKKKDGKSTSSDSGDMAKSGKSNSDTLSLSFSASTREKEKNKKRDLKHRPKSSEERRGWRKWHRKCHPCPVEMKLKWRDPRILWICGAFQRARRSFKSLCMMHYRNCQDGTMFVKIHDHRCANSSRQKPFGDHFFYDYHVQLPIDDSESRSSSSSGSNEAKSSAA